MQTTISYLQPRSETPPPQTLEYALKVWRMHEARKLERRPFDLIHDTVIHEIASHRPTTVEALRSVPGVRGEFAHQFGEQILSVVANHP